MTPSDNEKLPHLARRKVRNLNPRSTRKDKPSYRVRSVMRRLTWNTWLSPEEVSQIGTHLCREASHGSAGPVYKAAIPWCCQGVGMLRGEPPAQVYEPHYQEVLDVIRRFNGKNREAVMINLLKIARKA